MMTTPTQIVTAQRSFFLTGQTKSVLNRKTALRRLYAEIVAREDAICNAIYADFKKPKLEAFLSETQIVLAELGLLLKKLDVWTKPERITPSLVNFPSSDWLYKEPYGTVLVISPWNYPFNLAMIPLIGAIAAGNTVVLKPSERAPATAKIIAELMATVFSSGHVAVCLGDVAIAQELLCLRWDYIFFTGSSRVGRLVYEAAARNLSPVTLELGGKNPCIVDETAQLELAAKRIVWGKFFNAGQTCVAPDYLLVHDSIKAGFILALKKWISIFYGEDLSVSPDYARIIDRDHLDGLKAKLHGAHIILGGVWNDDGCYLSPTLVDSPEPGSRLMQEEIFGPILPIVSYRTMEDMHACLSVYEKPLATYIFSGNKKFRDTIIRRYSFGGGAINDTWIHMGNHRLPFGGVGPSGMGAYHGKRTFDTFTHCKPISRKANWLDIPLRYPPYTLATRYLKRLKHLF